jgi:hypothetical protein
MKKKSLSYEMINGLEEARTQTIEGISKGASIGIFMPGDED